MWFPTHVEQSLAHSNEALETQWMEPLESSIGSANWLHPSLTNLVGLQLVFYSKFERVP
jgi:hypothetical protein